jgi:predicted O-methyltransferase YrrM
LVAIIRRYPGIVREAFKPLQQNQSFETLPGRPQRNFEDLDWLLNSNPTNKGVLLMEFDEAAFLFRLARSKPASQIMEIGRYNGGSTFLLAVACDEYSRVTSIDIAPQNDALLQSALTKNGLERKVRVIVGDSVHTEAKLSFYDLIFIDGDHSYEGVLKDYQHWKSALKPGGHLIFHNAGRSRAWTDTGPGPARLVQEIEAHDLKNLIRQPDVGSLAIFLRTQTPWPDVVTSQRDASNAH